MDFNENLLQIMHEMDFIDDANYQSNLMCTPNPYMICKCLHFIRWIDIEIVAIIINAKSFRLNLQ